MKWIFALYAICLPLKKLEVTSPFGYRIHPLTGLYSFHNGVDLRARGDTAYAVTDGYVTGAGFSPRSGIFLKLDHRLFQSAYSHLGQLFVKPGDEVYAGQALAITGATGQVTGGHLHFSIFFDGSYCDPLKFLYKLLILQQHE